MRAAVGYACLALAIVLGAGAVVSFHYAIPLTGAAVLFGGLGVGVLAESTAPRCQPNPRTTCPHGQRWDSFCPGCGDE